jgi:excisionase family DNA binding protein
MATKKDGDQFISTREAAKLLGVSLTTAQTMAETGVLRSWKTAGGHRRIDAKSVEKYLLGCGPESRRTDPRSRKPYSILIAEDDEKLCRLYQSTIESWDIPLSITIAQSGVEVTFMIERARPNLLILDLKMPQMDGFELLRLVRNYREYDAMDIIVVTGMEPSAIAKRGGLAPGVTVFPKPVPWQQLRGFVQAAVSRHELVSAQTNL